MSFILKRLWEGYQLVFQEWADPRTKNWFLVAKPYQGIAVLVLYVTFIFKWGPKWMSKRPAYNLDKVLVVYNLMQVIACTYIFIKSLEMAWATKYKWCCEPVDYSNTPEALDIARLTYYYYFTKLIDLMDTVFFVLRKNHRQVSFLHIYHHIGMVILIWGAVTYVPGGHGTLIGVINCFVHIVMYSYYLYTVINPSAKNSVWWKKYITQLQIVQFFLCVIHMGVPVFITDCAYPRWISAVFLPQNIFILVLFIDFYYKTYIRKLNATKNKQQMNNNGTKHLQNGHQSANHNGHIGNENVSNGTKTKDPKESGHIVTDVDHKLE